MKIENSNGPSTEPSHDVGTESHNGYDDKGQADNLFTIERLLKARIVRGQQFYLVKWGITGKAREWVIARTSLK